MAQVKIYGLKEFVVKVRTQLSSAIHESLQAVFGLPKNKRFHRYILLDKDNFMYPSDRTDNYIIIELSLFEGRTVETKKNLIRMLYLKINEQTGISHQDIEITIFETPRTNWGIRGVPADELALDYKVTI